ncbi:MULTISPECIES: valine--tRNA ligase [unclassified Devosia]|uniref:valine--tRNA ligase n=1 Tax=unclassified Devosia TaxID=196773 RepID=UPI00086B99B1|nr:MULTISPECIES: valine--tRNA ligase [unclassified Devosia]MBN9361178.1 valine--tRNA ligase [Devosia sp.]ODS81242.1 MAG: valine--tRNA ligase [Devosia sp. SCN 66-27]OJX20947.1 MAG: valine--tRNA ligase [Devosia sp. 66-14]
MLEKTYDPAAVETRIYDQWDKAGTFKAGAGAKPGAETFSIVIPPPNVTGSLHIGHALNNTIQDILIRFERMRGKDVLWQPGTDHAGIATQMIVERQLAERQQPGRREMGREKFLERVWEWKAESGGTILNQLRRLGASADWSRERFTMDEGLSEAVRKVFVTLYEKGLIYRAKRLVNWHPGLETAISDLEVENIETNGKMWHLRYPIEGSDETITVATTRPETMLGDVAVAVHPEDERYKHLIGKHVILPLVGRRIPIIGDEYADPELGSGAVKITPAHDFNDFEVGQRHGLKPINILTTTAKLNNTVPAEYRGLDRFDARAKIIAELEASGVLVWVDDKKIMVPYDEKSKLIVIEPFLTDQWFVKADILAEPALASVREGRTKFVPKAYENTYYAWMENIKPWCISRQLWWGHQIPAWYGPRLSTDPEFNNRDAGLKCFVADSEAEAVKLAQAYYGSRKIEVYAGGVNASDYAKAVSSFDTTQRDRLNADTWNMRKHRDPFAELSDSKVPLHRDEDVLDTWFSSALWPFSTMGWPNQTPELKKYYPTDVLVTGFDIIFFWVARMMMMGLEFTGTEPFHTVYMHALVRDEKGQKMSKTKGNVIDPLNLVDEYGADATRFTLAAMAAQGRDMRLAIARVEGYRNFVTKLWNAARFLEMNGCARVEAFDPRKNTLAINRWIVGSTARAVANVTAALEDYRFNEAANAAYDFVWGTFCDWYIELAKPVFTGEDEAAKAETQATAAFALDQILKLLHPFMPFVTEELWAETGKTGPAREKLLIISEWPQLAGLEDPEAQAELDWLVSLISGIRSVRQEMNVPAGAKVKLLVVGAGETTGTRVEANLSALTRLARLESVDYTSDVPRDSAQLILGEATFVLPLAGVIDLDAERGRLKKDIAKETVEIDKIDKKLSNEQFLAKAAEEVIEEQRSRRAEAEDRRARLTEALSRLS